MTCGRVTKREVSSRGEKGVQPALVGWFTDTVSGQSAVRLDTSDRRTNIIVTIQKYSQWYLQYDKHFWKNNTFCIRHSTSPREAAWNTTKDMGGCTGVVQQSALLFKKEQKKQLFHQCDGKVVSF